MPTKIEWCDETWNPITGCSPVSEGCDHCYAQTMAQRLRGRAGYPADYPFSVTFCPDRLDQPLHWKKPRRIFVCSMGDLFHSLVSWVWIERAQDIMTRCPQHTFMLLTKRPNTMQMFFDQWEPLPNVELGVTAENQARLEERVPVLLQIPAAVRFVSLEPCLGPVALKRVWLVPHTRILDGRGVEGPTLQWVIVGAETGPGARPMDPDWARKVRDDCVAAGVPFFLKRLSDGSRLLDGRQWTQFPEVTHESALY